MFFWLRFLDEVCPEAFAVDSAPGVFFLGRRAACSVKPRDIVSHYMGAQRLPRHSASGLPRDLDRK
jgi:hypothetical protein